VRAGASGVYPSITVDFEICQSIRRIETGFRPECAANDGATARKALKPRNINALAREPQKCFANAIKTAKIREIETQTRKSLIVSAR
jgi:hypothetical protein